MRYDADYLLGRRYTMPVYIGNTIAGHLDVTIVGVDPERSRVRVHGENGQREYWKLAEFIALVEGGELVESILGGPFVIDGTTRTAIKKGTYNA